MAPMGSPIATAEARLTLSPTLRTHAVNPCAPTDASNTQMHLRWFRLRNSLLRTQTLLGS